jgi:hypothetical protein
VIVKVAGVLVAFKVATANAWLDVALRPVIAALLLLVTLIVRTFCGVEPVGKAAIVAERLMVSETTLKVRLIVLLTTPASDEEMVSVAVFDPTGRLPVIA